MIMHKPLFLFMALFVSPAFAAGADVASRVIPNNLNNSVTTNGDSVARTTTRSSVSRTVSSSTRDGARTSGADATSRSTVSRSTTSRANATASRGTTARAGGNTKEIVSRSTVGDINANPAVRRAGVVLRPSFADYGGRATISGTTQQTGSNIKTDIQKVSGRAAKKIQATKESIAEAKEKLEQTAELNKSCQEQYNECMDQFCSVIDANQKRCSCSSNLSKYTKVEKAVTDANTKLNEVAQAIRYVGLSADEIRAIMTETEAEAALDENKDTSTTRNMLKQIESMIKDPTSRTTSYAADTSSFGLDMDLTFSSDPIDIFNLDFLNTGVNSTSISNLRGTELYNTARKRCSTILNQCKDAGATQTQITGNYDLAIDKDCIAYEAGLKKMNETLLSNVKSANLMLQKARLAVLQNKNQYDAKGCVAALESCMKDDMVCGDDYFQCVDPTKAYIDENGDVVLGQDITVIQSFMTKYNNASIDSTYLGNAYDNTTIGANSCTNDGKCIVKYLLQKIGTKDRALDEGLCRPVLDKCQNYTYDKDGKYIKYNDVVVNYIQRAMVNIKAAQQKIISEYASSCILDVAACYNQQISQVSSWTSSASTESMYNVMRGACRSVALTCGLAIFAGEPKINENTSVNVPDNSGGYSNYTVSGCPGVGSASYGSAQYNDAIINCVSDMFYSSSLCPSNATYQTTEMPTDDNGTRGGMVTKNCRCLGDYDVFNGKCLYKCGDDQSRYSSGNCYCTDETKQLQNGVCVAQGQSGGNGGSETPSSDDTCVLTINKDGGNCNVSSSNYSMNTSVDLGICTKTGYDFNEWRCNGEKTTSLTCNNNTVVCEAVYTAKTYTVTLDANGGNGGTPKVIATYGSSMPDIDTPSRTDYTFVGFYDTSAASGGTMYYDVDGASANLWNKTNDATLYARWAIGDSSTCSYTINTNGGTCSHISGSAPQGAVVSWPSCTRDDAQPKSWSCTPDSITHDNDGFVCAAASITCTAQWPEIALRQMQLVVDDLKRDKPTLGAELLSRSTPSYSLVRTVDNICLLYNTTGTEPKPDGVGSCDINLDNL